MDRPPMTIARGGGVLGEVVLRRRPPDRDRPAVHELIVNGTFLMDTAETATERALATAAAPHLPTGAYVLIGGLGLGFTLAALLDTGSVAQVDVVEIEPLVLDWIGRGLVPETAGVLEDSRVRSQAGDVREVVEHAAAATYDAILLDVDNGPDFLAHDRNGPLYRADFVRTARRTLRPGGVLAVWSAAPSPSLFETLRAHLGHCHEIVLPVTRGERRFDYHLYVGLKTSAGRP